ncbi:MAG: hypothetical protein ACKE8R_06815 [Methylophagaceae bacterium]
MKKFLILLSALLLSVQAQAALVGVVGGGEIIAAVSVQEDSITNDHQQGFNEQQGVLLGSAVTVDTGHGIVGGTVAAGMRVDSHLIFLNTAVGTPNADTTSTWEFDGDIVGVMSDQPGNLMTNTDSLFAAFNDYFTTGTASPFNAQGLEGNDSYGVVAGNFLRLHMLVSEPGDWIRVLTVSAVPVPAALFLFAPALLGFLGLRRKVSNTTA